MKDIANKKIGILGLGDENIALLKYLIKHEAKDIAICDEKSRQELQSRIDEFASIDINIKFELGDSYLNNLNNFDIIFRTPGLPYLNKKILAAKNSGVKISSAIKLFFELSQSPIIGVTGTKGKGTTATLIYEILKKDGKSVKLAGNIGNSPLEFVDKLSNDDIVVLELSSFQLQDMEKSPHIAVVLDVKSDHLNYHTSQEEYVASKENIVAHQTKDDFAIINADYETSKQFSKKTPAKIFWFSRRGKATPGAYVSNNNIILNIDGKENIIAKTSEVTLRGDHNLENICASITAVSLIDADIESIKKIVKTFIGLEHRLEFVAEIGNVKFYNDSFSTTPDTAIVAIKSFTESIILIAGGSEKKADYSKLGETIASSNVKTAILIGETGPKIMSNVKCQMSKDSVKPKIIDTCKNLVEVIETVKSEMKSGDIVLFSPASASFDWFRDYKDRGKQFKDLVLNMQKENL